MSNILRWQNFRNISINDPLEIGTLVKGYTYFSGDFHDKFNKNGTVNVNFGKPKLRLGVVVEKYSNDYYKVQFRNGRAKNNIFAKNGLNIVNSIPVYDSYNGHLLTTIRGTNSFCMIVRRDTLTHRFKHDTNAVINNADIRVKQSDNKKRTEKRFFLKQGALSGKSGEEINRILKIQQFVSGEINMLDSRAREKYDSILIRHNSKLVDCVPKELKKMYELLTKYFPNEMKDDFQLVDKFEQEMSKEFLIENAQKIKPLSGTKLLGFLEGHTILTKSELNK